MSAASKPIQDPSAANAAPDAFQLTALVERGSEIEYQSDTNYYYRLHSGSDVREITSVRNMGLGDPETGMLSDRGFSLQAKQGFYGVLRIPIAAPLDYDQDGMDDVFELRSPILDALDASDAMGDPDGDGFGNVYEHTQGSDLTNAASAPMPTLYVNASAPAGGPRHRGLTTGFSRAPRTYGS